jgi:hypothetical protein
MEKEQEKISKHKTLGGLLSRMHYEITSYCSFCSFACFCRALLNIPRCLSRSCLIVFHIFSSSELLSFLASSMYVSIVEYRNCASLPSAIKMLYVEFSSLVVSSFVVDPCEDIAFQGQKKAKKVTHLFSWPMEAIKSTSCLL